MKNIENQIEKLYEFQEKTGYIERIQLYRDIDSFDSNEFTFEIVLSDYPFFEKKNKLLLKCNGIKQFNLRDIDNLYKAFIVVENISKFQMEDINYSVKETENDFFSFVCKDICVNWYNGN